MKPNSPRDIITHIQNAQYYNAVFLLRKLGYDEPFFTVLERWGMVEKLETYGQIIITKTGLSRRKKELQPAIDSLHEFMKETFSQ